MLLPDLIIPTVSSRADLLRRTLSQLAQNEYKAPVLVIDDSEPGDSACREIVSLFSDKITVQHRCQKNGQHFLERIADALAVTNSDYVMLHADDDFAVLSGLAACVSYLESNPDTVVCQGRMAHIAIVEQDSTKVVEVSRYLRRERIEEQPLLRLVKLLEKYSATLYGVHRRARFLEAVEHTLNYSTDVTYWQYLLSCISALQGKNAIVEDLQYLRQKHDRSWSATAVRERDPEHVPWIFLSPDFSRLTQAFRNGITDYMRLNYGEPPPGFWFHFDSACLGLFRRALGCSDQEKACEQDEKLFKRLSERGTYEYAMVSQFGSALMESECL